MSNINAVGNSLISQTGTGTFVGSDNPTINNPIFGMSFSTYSPTIGDGTNNFTLSTANGYYLEIGPLVFFWAHVQWTALNSASGNVLVSTPIPAGSIPDRPVPNIGFISGINIGSGYFITCGIDSGTASAKPFVNDNNGFVAVLQVSQCNSSGEIQLQGIYGT